MFDVSQVVPDYSTGNARVYFALMASHSRGAGGSATPRVLVEVRPFGGDLESDRHERRMVARCARVGAPLAALADGRRWTLLFQSPEENLGENRLGQLDLTDAPEAAAEDLDRYLSRDRVASGQAARLAERLLRDPEQGGSLPPGRLGRLAAGGAGATRWTDGTSGDGG